MDIDLYLKKLAIKLIINNQLPFPQAIAKMDLDMYFNESGASTEGGK